MNDVQVTLVGTITSEIRFAHHGEVPVARFRIRAQPRRFNKATNTWHDGEPSYYTAVAWRHLAEHVASSLGIGDPVLAHGRLRISRWRPGDDPTLTAEVELVSVGHDLRWGTTVYRKSQPPPTMRRPPARGDDGRGEAELVGAGMAGGGFAGAGPVGREVARAGLVDGSVGGGGAATAAGTTAAGETVSRDAESAAADRVRLPDIADPGAASEVPAAASAPGASGMTEPGEAPVSAAPVRKAPARRRALAVVRDPGPEPGSSSPAADRAPAGAAMPRAA